MVARESLFPSMRIQWNASFNSGTGGCPADCPEDKLFIHSTLFPHRVLKSILAALPLIKEACSPPPQEFNSQSKIQCSASHSDSLILSTFFSPSSFQFPRCFISFHSWRLEAPLGLCTLSSVSLLPHFHLHLLLVSGPAILMEEGRRSCIHNGGAEFCKLDY